jgi:hypothetical protein
VIVPNRGSPSSSSLRSRGGRKVSASCSSAGAAPGGDVEAVGVALVEVPVGREGRHRDERAGRKGDLAVLDRLEQDARRERRHRLVAQHLLGCPGGARGVGGEHAPLVGVLGEQANAVRELALRRVDAAVEDVAHERRALVVGQPVALVLRHHEARHQVVARAGAPVGDTCATRAT